MKNQLYFYIIGTVILLFVVYQTLKKIGLVRDVTERRQDKMATRIEGAQEREILTVVNNILKSKFFNPNFYKSANTNILLDNIKASQLSTELHSSFGWRFWNYGDDEERIYGVFRRLQNKTQISQLADEYFLNYGKDLAGVLVERLDRSELVKLMSVINTLPDR